MDEFWNVLQEAENLKKNKFCIYPNKEECKGKIKRAHTIQNNRILNKVADNGKLIVLNEKVNLMFQGSGEKGRGIVSTFWGFCDYHDTTLFEPIENYNYDKSLLQTFLYTYRTFCWHYYLKLEDQAKNKYIYENISNEEVKKGLKSSDLTKGLELGISDNSKLLKIFNNALLVKNYDILDYYILEIPYEVKFCCCGMIQLYRDLLGNKINDYDKLGDIDTPLKNLYINIFPENNKSYCIFSWLKSDSIYENFITQFSRMSLKNKINYLNNMLPRETDKIFINPLLWKKFGEGVQQSLLAHCNFGYLYTSMNEEKTFCKKWKYMYTPWNLFDCSKL